jgi:hypothetical protein
MQLGSVQANEANEGSEVEDVNLKERLDAAVNEFKQSTIAWGVERAALLQDRDVLLQEIDDVRAIKGLEKFNFVSSLPTIEIPPSEEMFAELVIDTTGMARLSAEQAMASNDINRMRDEIAHQVCHTCLLCFDVFSL